MSVTIGYKIRSSVGWIYTVTKGNINDMVKQLEGKSNKTIENELFAMDAEFVVDKTVYQDPHMPQFKPAPVPPPYPEPTPAPKVIVSDRQVGGTHYKDMNIEPWAAIKSWLTRDEWIGFLRGNIIKYQARANSGKGTVAENLRKANHYAETLEKTLQEPQLTVGKENKPHLLDPTTGNITPL